MAKLSYKFVKPPSVTAAVLVSTAVVLFLPLLNAAVSLLPSSWNPVVSRILCLWKMMIQQRPFILILLNFIIIFLLLASSSSSSLRLNLLLLKFHSKPDPNSNQCGDDTLAWWCQLIHCEVPTWEVEQQKAQVDTAEEEEVVKEEFVSQEGKGEGEEKARWKAEEQIHEVDTEVKEGVIKGGREEKEDDTLDATWKTIMDAKSKRSTGPQMKKSETWSAGGGRLKAAKERLGGCQAEMKKWRTFREGGGEGKENEGGGWRRMEAVLTDPEELKNRADEFIARFARDMRLQRLESDQRFLDMINRGL